MAAIARPLRAYLLAGVAFVLSLGVTAHGAEFDREFGCTDVALFNGLLGHSASDLPRLCGCNAELDMGHIARV